MFALETFLAVLELLLHTAGQPYQQAGGLSSGPSLAEVLVDRYRSASSASRDADTQTWYLTDEQRSEFSFCLIIDVPILMERMYRRITEDWWEPSRVLDIAALREQMQGEARLAYRRKYGAAG
jgi:hypothetical protein